MSKSFMIIALEDSYASIMIEINNTFVGFTSKNIKDYFF